MPCSIIQCQSLWYAGCQIFMPKIARPLNDLQVRRITKIGWHAVGGVAGLLIQVRKPSKDGGVTE